MNRYKFFREHLHFITLVGLAVIFIWTVFNNSKWRKNEVIQWDVYGYTMYLSSTIIYHDIKTLKHFDEIDRKYRPCGDSMGYARHDCGGENKTFKYTCGNALMMAPFYVTAHFLTVTFGAFPADGYSQWYQMAVAMSTIFWAVMGMFFLILVLRRWLDPVSISIAIICLGLGTNFFYYTTLEPGMTHIPSFFWFAFSCYGYLKWFENSSWKYALLTGFSFGFIALIRPTDMVYAIIPGVLFTQIFFTGDSRKRINLLLQAFSAILLIFVLFFLQMIYWKYVTGYWLHDSYVGEHLDFFHPHLADGLFSYKKGWLVYTPIMLFALSGVPLLIRKKFWLGLGILFYLLVNWWVVFSWAEWWYGGSFGARSLVQSYAVLMIPLAFIMRQCLVENIESSSFIRKATGVIATIVLLLFISLNLFQIVQYKYATLHWDKMSKKAYWGIWGKLKLSGEEYREYYP